MRKFQVTGMSCAACSARVEKAVKNVTGVTSCSVSLLTNSMRVEGEVSDKEIMETAEEFLENNLNASETARKIYVHRNTLMYRLDKIEKVTGLNIRNFADAVTFRFMTILYKASKR